MCRPLCGTRKPPLFPPEPADVVFCDAPCSGLGILRRKPEIRYKKPESLEELPGLQKRILQESAKLVKPGGRLVYSTCTLNPHENGEVAEDFLKNHPEFTPIPVWIPEGNGPLYHGTGAPADHDAFFLRDRRLFLWRYLKNSRHSKERRA